MKVIHNYSSANWPNGKATFNKKVTTLSSQSCRPSLIPLTIATKKAWSDAVDLVFTKIQLSHKMLQHGEIVALFLFFIM